MLSTPILRAASICLALALPGAALAQEEAPDTDEMPVEPAIQREGEPVIAATHRDWQIVCNQFGENGQEMCEMIQPLELEGEPIAEIYVVPLPADAAAAAGATIITPLETFLPTGLGFRIDDSQPRQEPFAFCAVFGCVAQLGLDSSEVTAMQRGANAFVTIAHYAAVNEPIEIPVSLMGFTAAFEDLQARMPAE